MEKKANLEAIDEVKMPLSCMFGVDLYSSVRLLFTQSRYPEREGGSLEFQSTRTIYIYACYKYIYAYIFT